MRIKLFVILSILLASAHQLMAQTDTWKNYQASGYDSGSGTEADPYVIKTAGQLAYFANRISSGQDLSVCVELRANIDLSAHYWAPIGEVSGVKPNSSFAGTFEGHGFTISNMKQSFANAENTAFFANLKGNSVVRNLNFDNADIQCEAQWNNTRRVGILAGATYGSPKIENIAIRNAKIHVDGNFTQTHYYLIGGLIGGSFNNATIKNCYVDVDIDLSKVKFADTSKSWFAQVVGAEDNDVNSTFIQMTNVYSAGTLKLSDNVNYPHLGTMTGRNPQKVSYTDCYYKNQATDKTGTALTLVDDAHNTGTQKEGSFASDFISLANKSLGTNDLNWVTDGNGQPKVYTQVRQIAQSHTDHTSKKVDVEVAYNDASADKDTYTYIWTLSPNRPMEGSGKKVSIECYYKDITGSVKVMEGSTLIEELPFTIKPMKYSEDLYADKFYSSGNGTKEDPYIIDDDMQFAKFARDVTTAFPENGGNNQLVYSGTYFKLGKDIDLSSALWMPIGNWCNLKNRCFAGKFDGAGHTIDNVRMVWQGRNGSYWSLWGLFSRLAGTASNEAGFCSVSNFILNHVSMEKEAGTLLGEGHNIGTIAGEIAQNTELSNIIVKNAVITDNNENYTTSIMRLGGLVGNVDNAGVYRVYNLSSDTKMDLLSQATLTKSKQINISKGFGRYMIAQNTNSYHIYPTNIYVLGDPIAVSGRYLYRGTVIGDASYYPKEEQLATWYYEKGISLTGITTRDLNVGVEKDPATFGSTFAQQTNKFLDEKDFTDKSFWVYTPENGFSFGKTTIKVDRQEDDVLTAETVEGNAANEQYDWYVSSDKKTWDKVSTEAINPFTLPRQEYDQYVYAVLKDGSSCSRYEKVSALRVSASLKTDSIPDTYVIKVENNIWDNNDHFNITYEWMKNNETVGRESTYKPGTLADNDKVGCHVIVKDLSGNTVLDQWVYKVTVVYLKPTGDISLETDLIDDKTWGYSPDKPMRTWRGAYSKLEKNASWNENVIVLMQPSSYVVTQGFRERKAKTDDSPAETDDEYKTFLKNASVGTGFNMTINYKGYDDALGFDEWSNAIQDSIMTRNVTITGKWENNDYTANASIEFNGDTWGLPLWGDTRFENITFKHKYGSYDIIYCQYHNLEMGEGVIMSGMPSAPGYGTIDGANTVSVQIFGGFKNDARFDYPSNPAKLMDWAKYQPHGRDGFSIKLLSGWYSCVCVGGRHTGWTFNGTMGVPTMPVKGTIDIDIDQDYNDKHIKVGYTPHYDVGIVLAGNHEGAMFADADLIIRSGRVARVVNGTLGNVRNRTYYYDKREQKYPNNTFMGRANILLAPETSEHFHKGEDLSTTNERVVVTELYGGGTGRGYAGNQTIDNPFYGISTITINGGTFKILPADNRSASIIFSGIYGAGAGGMNGIGDDKHHTNDQRIPYWNADKTVMLFGPYDTAKNNLITYNCYNADTHTHTDIDPRNSYTKIVINGGVFGSKSQPIDGIYAGGSGYMSSGLFTRSEVTPNVDGGNVYGKEGETVSSLTINGGEFYCTNGIFAGGRGTDSYYSDNPYNGTASNYTDLGKTYGNVELTINGGNFYCPVFGGGYGVADAKLYKETQISTLYNMARIYGKSTVNITGGTFYKNVYGGGDMAAIEYYGKGNATNLTIGGNADIRGSVFGGGNGRPFRASGTTIKNDTQLPDSVGKVIGTTSVTFVGDIQQAPYVYGDIYGGGNMAQVVGSTNVSIYAAHFAGQVFGGGNGLLYKLEDTGYTAGTVRNSADVFGNTSVSLAKDQNTENKEADSKEQNFSINVIWDRLWYDNGSTQGFRTFNVDNVDYLFFNTDGTFVNPHNIYGGGNLACNVTGKATVNVQKGMTSFNLLKTSQWKANYTDNDHPHFYVFGGGYGKNTSVASTDVTVDVEGDYGEYDAEIDDDTEQLSNRYDFFNGERRTRRQNRVAGKTDMNVFDNSKGIPNFTVLGVMGGGYSGIVQGNTKVTVDGQTFLHRVYGGGFGDPTSTEDNTTGQVGGNTEVYVQGAKTYGDVFGGGAGVAPKTASGVHFTNVARVLGKTMVEVSDDANVYGNVYGGGDIANVGPENYTHATTFSYKNDQPVSKTTLDQQTGAYLSYKADNYRSFVNIVGGDIYGEVFGGGKGLKKLHADHYENLGRISGNTLVHIANTITTASQQQDNNYYIPYIWNRIYGGCAFGTVDGNTLVHVEGGMLGLNIFGGGYGDVELDNDGVVDDSQSTGASTPMDILSQVLGKKDTKNEATYANILGNTKVQIDGGSWIWNQRADINGNILSWTSSDADNEKVCADYNDFRKLAFAMENPTEADAATLARVQAIVAKMRTDKSTLEFFDINSLAFKKNHNIFGGGNRACFVGTYATDSKSDDFVKPAEGSGDAVVVLNHSPLTDIKDSKGNLVSLLDQTKLQGFCWAFANSNKSHPQFSVFGAGYGANTKVGNTYVYAQPGVKADANSQAVKDGEGNTIRYLNQRSDGEVYGQVMTTFADDFDKISRDEKKRYYGGGSDNTDDAETYQRYRASRIAWALGVPNFSFFEIHGGGFSGYVAGNTYVETDCQLNCRNLFGAGLGSAPAGEYSSTENYNFGSIGGTSKIFMKGGYVSRNVYGGGAGVESVRVDGKNFVSADAKSGKLFDFSDMAHVNNTEVHIYGDELKSKNTIIDRTMIFGSVYGGGDVANVGTTKADAAQISPDAYLTTPHATLVNLRGGSVFSQIFAGGCGRVKSQCADYTKLGGVYGNTCLVSDRPVKGMVYPYTTMTGDAKDPSSADNMASPADDTVNPDYRTYIFNRLYGGCENGTVYGNTIVAINDGMIGHNMFGGGWGQADTLTVDNNQEVEITSADVTGNTNLVINGGRTMLTSYWNPDKRFWKPSAIVGDKTYSPQYDPDARKFYINHNIYAGGNTACVVGEQGATGDLKGGNTYLTMVKGLLYDDTRVLSVSTNDKRFFERDEWKEVYQKVGSPHFCVFGGGYGENTDILGDTYVTVDMNKHGSLPDKVLKEGEEYKHFLSGYSVMDIVGGGYSGRVEGTTHIVVDGGVFCRRIFGGGCFNSVGATDVEAKAIDCHDIFGGGLMGDVLKSTNVKIGYDTATPGADGLSNRDIYIHGDIYGGNDVSGYVNVTLDANGFFADNGGNGTKIDILGGHIFGNVYGAGNGDYLYALDKKGHTKVTVNEHYPLNPNDPDSETEPLVYTVPMRETMPSYKAASDAAKIVNINSWRPLTNKVDISIKGQAAANGQRAVINGDVYGGGNSATVQKVQQANARANITVGAIKINIGSHVNIGRVFMGCNGDALFTTSEDNDFMNKFQKLNGDVNDYSKELNLADTIDWMGDPSNKGISTLYLSTKNDDRPTVYPHLLDLYFQPVETDIQGELLWNGDEEGKGLEDCTIGTFCCGGNRGNMNVYPVSTANYSAGDSKAEQKVGNVLEYTFPAGLTITDKIVGGCNNANYDYKGKVTHEGGYLLGQAHSAYPFIKLNIKNQFKPTETATAYVGGNVYGGCYKSGTVRGDVTIDLQSDMLSGKSVEKLKNSNDSIASKPEYSALNVYGAGYGMESYVYGNTHILMANGVACEAPKDSVVGDSAFFAHSGTSANFVYGGGQQGNVIGVTTVEIFNGHVFRSVTGGSYSGYVWGSTQVKVGYPKYYKVNNYKSGLYSLHRIDQNNKDIDKGKKVASETIKQTIHLITDDMISQAVYNDIVGKYDSQSGTYLPITADNKAEYFTEVPAATTDWDKINIKIGEAVYGGGYSLAQGSSVMANNTTVLKFTKDYNIDNAFASTAELVAERQALPGGTTANFGGNTTILIADRTEAPSGTGEDRDHITISHQDMKEAEIADGQDLLGYYYKDTNGEYHYIFQAGKYYKGGSVKEGTLPSDIAGTAIYEYDNDGGIFGDGHLSYAQGFRSADLTGYGFASSTIKSPKIINTFQRLDVLRLTDNCFSLLGARDYATNAMDKTPYSISRVGEIQMIAGNVKTEGDVLADKTTHRSRNYMGLANNIHYVGALNSNVAFTEPWHDGDGKLGDYQGASTYKAVKQKYIDDYFSTSATNENRGKGYIFEQRNNGTAKNMIGIASGYALKIQNVQELIGENGAEEDHLYYGPVYGVIEMNLIDVREDEGGGYVYADNVHKRGDDENKDVDFLETSGNFVFPYTPTQGRYIVDDCFPVGYTSLTTDGQANPDDAVTAHYWYVTGFNYHYTAHITGFTFDSSGKSPLQFNSNNQDGIVALSGLKPKQDVTVVNWKMHSAHDTNASSDYKCDLEDRNYTDADIQGKYTLHVGAANAQTYVKPLESGETAADDTHLPGFAADLSMDKRLDEGNYTVLKSSVPDKLTDGDARIVFQLTDNVNNSTSEYYNAHLSQPCRATLTLAAKAMQEKKDDSGELEQVEGKVALSKLYTKNADGTYTEVSTGTLNDDTEYFYKSGETDYYQSTAGRTFWTWHDDEGEYKEVKKSEVTLGNKDVVYYCDLPRYYTYTVDLTIEYVQGPDIEGQIDVENCALPGERIRVRKNGVVVKADQSLSVNGYYWRIGKRHKDADGQWVFEDTTPWSKYNTANGYDTFDQSSKEGKGFFAGCFYDKTEDYLEIPAYYYMNGYGIQLGVTMNVPGLNDIFPVKMVEANQLVVHNYHRMDPHKTGVNLHLAEAVARAKAEPDTFAEPRIYISDQSDLTAFFQFVDSIGSGENGGYMDGDKEYVKLGAKEVDGNWVANLCEVPRYGANAQFVLQNDLSLVNTDYDGSLLEDFSGTLHGNGHVVRGLQPGHCLFNAMSGNVYNLGLSSGKITNMTPASGKIANYHCCFEYAPSQTDGASSPVVYRMDGTLDTHYTVDDFRYGRVAYDLNQYYLRARYSHTTEADKAALDYVYQYYANGDYQYASRTDAITGKNTGVTYLRTGKDSDLPNYDQAETRHDRTHAKDLPRLLSDGTSTSVVYEPLFNDNHEEGATEKMNDFIFWGQSLQSTPADYPSEIASRMVSYMSNRVYRTAGYYGDTKLGLYHYNAYSRGISNMSTYVHNPATTAIDFTCANDVPAAEGMTADNIYYPPVADNASVFHDFNTKEGVTQNLLVYTASDDANNEDEAYDVVDKALSYGETTKEAVLKGHHVAGSKDNFFIQLLHLVERTPDGKNSEGEDCANNDFCVPLPFSVTDHAWYVRKPMYYATDKLGAWEGICLPFTVDKATATINGELTHFYGTPDENEQADPKLNTHTLHHEYWLRGLVSVGEESGTTSALYQRPGTADGLFVNDAVTSRSYEYNNPFFVSTYLDKLYNKKDNPYYDVSHTYKDYLPLTSGVPYIVRFPGNTYYEFDLTSAFYSSILSRSASPQTITFHAYGTDNASSTGDLVIPMTTTMTTAANGYVHQGTFAAKSVEEGSVYGMNEKGTGFDDASTLSTVMPFRTYMAPATQNANRTRALSSVINISEPKSGERIVPELLGGDDATGDYLIIRPLGGQKVRIESSRALTLQVYTVAGQLYRVLDIQSGSATYSGFPAGIYLFGTQKTMVK